jgi:hypothetical protein
VAFGTYSSPTNGLPSTGRPPLQPGPPVRGLWWLRSFGGRSRLSKGLAVTLVLSSIALTLGLGAWGFTRLKLTRTPLGVALSIYRAAKLYTLDLGPAAGGSNSPHPNWQLWVAFALAALLVLRGVLLLGRERLRRAVSRVVLRDHVIVCGGGVHGARLVRELATDHDVVLVDNDPASAGMSAPRGSHEWRVVGDCVRDKTLLDAGLRRANWVVAVPGHDFVSSQVVSTVRSLAKSGMVRDRAHVLVQVEDPTLTRFLEEEEEVQQQEDAQQASEQAGRRPLRSRRRPPPGVPIVSPFSANAIAAEALLDEAEVKVKVGDGEGLASFLQMRHGKAPNLLLAGDHPLIGALVLACLRRWRVRVLRELESAMPHQRPPLHVSVVGPGAVARADALRALWQPEPEVLSIEARDLDPGWCTLDDLADWLHSPDRADHAVVACQDELEGIRLTLELSRALGGAARTTRVTGQSESALDAHLEERTMRNDDLATTSVRSLADLACRPSVMSRLEGRQRLADALARDSSPRAPGDELVAQLYERAEALGIRSDSAWRIRSSERPMVRALLDPVPLSAVVRAGLRVELARPDNLRRAAQRLSVTGPPEVFAAWCEYVRALGRSPTTEQLVSLSMPTGDEDADVLVALRRAVLGDVEALADLPPDGSLLRGAPRVAIIAGPTTGVPPSAATEVDALLKVAFERYDGIVLSAATGSGLPGIVARAAHERGLARQFVGYGPPGLADRGLYPVVRETTVRETAGTAELSVRPPLAMWTDVLRAGIPLDRACLLAFAVNDVATNHAPTNEILLARALGAKVAVVDPTGALTRSLDEVLPLGANGVLEIPADPMTVRAFLQWSQLPADTREVVARYIHNDYRRKARGRKAVTDPAMAPWEDLLGSLKGSNRAQADDIPNKLALIGREISKGGPLLELTADEVELLAEEEHGRWNIERLSTGWRSGERQVRLALTPHLKPWAQLDDVTREYDRDAVRTIGPALAEAGWGVEEATGERCVTKQTR